MASPPDEDLRHLELAIRNVKSCEFSKGQVKASNLQKEREAFLSTLILHTENLKVNY